MIPANFEELTLKLVEFTEFMNKDVKVQKHETDENILVLVTKKMVKKEFKSEEMIAATYSAIYKEEFNTILIKENFGFGFMSNVEKVDIIQSWVDQNLTFEQYNVPTLSLEEIVQRLKDETITIDTNGHNRGLNGSFDYAIKDVKRKIIWHYEHQIKGSDPKEWMEVTKGDVKRSNDHAERCKKAISDKMLKTRKSIIEMSDGVECHACGGRHPIILLDENTISLGQSFDKRQEGDLNYTCVFADGIKPKEVEVNIESGEFIIGNYFLTGEDYVYEPDSDKRYNYYSLNSVLGRMRLMDYYASHNVGYGQMGNMSIGVFINPQRDKIIIGDAYHEDRCYEQEDAVDPQYAKAMEEGFKQVGSISLSVWRFMFGDKAELDKAGVIFDDKHRNHANGIYHNAEHPTEDNDYSQDFIQMTVPKGKWKLTHYYDFTASDDREDFVYATVELIK